MYEGNLYLLMSEFNERRKHLKESYRYNENTEDIIYANEYKCVTSSTIKRKHN